MNEKIDLIYDLVKDTNKKQDRQNERLTRLEEHVSHNSDSLDEHIEGVVQTRELIAINKQDLETKCSEMKHQIDKRLTKMQEPKLVLKTLGKWVIGIGSLAGAAYAILRLINAL